ncbi:hypothetical protein Zmor_012104 [Zophobas morio]|uniref:Uncharacterized protein n=1 Tax=Zophobas morio TaxID=2755281 RepID=A0AA38LZ35_9CUCU|nr:hypothetical protein Zmor_012104 [Zophobas morio]
MVFTPILLKSELSVEVYKLFAEAQGLSLEDSLWGAVEACGEYQRQFDLLLYVFERVESVQGSVRLLQLLLCCMDSSKVLFLGAFIPVKHTFLLPHHQLYDVQTRITFGTLSLFNEQTLPVLLGLLHCFLSLRMLLDCLRYSMLPGLGNDGSP